MTEETLIYLKDIATDKITENIRPELYTLFKCGYDLGRSEALDWHDPEDPPDNDRYILIHFSNFSLPQIGRYEGDPEHGGNYYLGDETETALSQYLYVNGWMEIPKYSEDNT